MAIKKRGRPPGHPLASEMILGAIQRSGGTATPASLEDHLDIPSGVLQRRLAQLANQGVLARVARGIYRLAPHHLALPEESRRIVEVLDSAALDAHLTGFAPLAPFVHQFVRQFPQLVYAEPVALDAVEFELSSSGYVVARLQGRKRQLPAIDDLSRLVLLRAQPNAEQYGVRGNLAAPEKAWVDLLRESHRGNLPMQFTELGRILRNAIDAGANVKRLKQYARRMGYLHWVSRALGGAPASDDDRIEALRGGYQG